MDMRIFRLAKINLEIIKYPYNVRVFVMRFEI